jgi:hypothetical protein
MQKTTQVQVEHRKNERPISKWPISVSDVTWIGKNDETLDV